MLVAALLGAPALGCRAPAPSVLVIVIDTWRADALGRRPRGLLPHLPGSASPTPAIDAWARDGLRLTRALTPAPLTMPAMAALWTGAWPDRTGVVAHEPGTTLASWPGATLAESARRSGVRTAAVVANPWLSRAGTGFDRGFERFVRLYDPAAPAGSSSAAAVTREAIGLLDEAGSGRFLVWAHYFDPHMPYLPPAADAEAAGADPAPSAVMEEFASKDRDLGRLLRGEGFDAGELERARRLYLGEVIRSDREVGRLLDHLRSIGREDDTIVVVTADHGEAMGEHGLFFAHDYTLHDELLHVPLVLRGPGVAAGEKTATVSLVDLAPTLCALAGLGCDASAMDGRSLLEPVDPRRPVFAASSPRRRKGTPFDGIERDGLDGRWAMAERGGLRVIEKPGTLSSRIEGYDLGADPLESSPFDATTDARTASLATELAAWRRDMGESRPAPPPALGMRARRRAESTLRSLGYLD